MTGAFSIDRAELLESIARLETFEAKLAGAMDATVRHVNELHSSWSGSAAQAHREAHERWLRGTEEMHAALVVMRKIAHGAHGNYSAAVTANTSMWAM